MDKFEAKTLLQKLDIVQGFLDKKFTSVATKVEC